MLNVVLGLVPVLLFLTGLFLMDSFKLVRPRTIAIAMTWGAVAALICFVVYEAVVGDDIVSSRLFIRYAAPVSEETAKALFVAFLIARRRVGFLVDAAILGFAVGTGFALVENFDYLRHAVDAPVALWAVRGLGTAVLHGATMAIFAMLSKAAADRHPERRVSIFIPSWAAAVVIHAAFNHVPLPPVAMTALLLAILPILVLQVFERSERATREWVGGGMNVDLELLQLMTSDTFLYTRFATYLHELRQRFPGVVVADMLCLLRIELELSVQTKALLIARRMGLDLAVHDDVRAGLAEREHLQASIGKTGLLALGTLQVTSYRDDWHRHLLAESGSLSRYDRFLGPWRRMRAQLRTQERS